MRKKTVFLTQVYRRHQLNVEKR